jgi:hypothetical protein
MQFRLRADEAGQKVKEKQQGQVVPLTPEELFTAKMAQRHGK